MNLIVQIHLSTKGNFYFLFFSKRGGGGGIKQGCVCVVWVTSRERSRHDVGAAHLCCPHLDQVCMPYSDGMGVALAQC